MNKTIYKQTDSRWGNLSYPAGNTMAGCGCGCVALTHIAIEQYDKQNWDPKKVRKHMLAQGHALKDQGTKWEGITETLKWLGHDKVVRIYDNDPMTDAWKELNKGNRIGIILFNDSTAPNGTKWSGSGHYVAFTKYKFENGLHKFYCKDSGWRNHDGWFSYEKSMKGCIPKMWIVKKITQQDRIIKKAKELAWVQDTPEKTYAWYGGAATKAFQKAIDAVYPTHKKWGKAPSKGCSCDVFVGTVVRASGVDKKMPRGFDEQWKYHSEHMKRFAFKNVAPHSVIKPGDVVLYWKKADGSSKHVLIYGTDCIYEAQHEKTYGHYKGSVSKLKEVRPRVVVFRAKNV